MMLLNYVYKAGSRLVAYPRIVSVWTVPGIILPLQNVDTVICKGLFAQLVVFSHHIKGTTRVAVVPVWTCTRCIMLCFSAPHIEQLECVVITSACSSIFDPVFIL
jgi:hypothetical protein